MNETDKDLARDLDLILSTDAEAYAELTSVVRQSILDDDLSTNDVPNAYRSAHNYGDSNWYGFIECAGLRVSDKVLDMVNDSCMSIGRDLLIQRLDLNNRAVWSSFTESMMPDPDDLFGDE